MNWEVKRMDECCLSISDGDHLPPPKADKGVPFITITNIDPVYNTIDFSDTMFVPEDYFCSLQEIRKPREGDILYSVVGSFGIPVLIGGNHNFTFQRHIAILRPNQDVVIPEYLYYVMKSRSFFAQADSYAIGSAQRTISLSSLRKMKIPVPDLPEQKRLASVLSAFDNLIKVNNRRIKVLEQMAENLYKEWFVRFRFPGHENTKFNNGIPIEWTIKRLGEYGRVETGKTPSMEVEEYYGDDYLFIKTPEMHGNVFVIDTEEKLSELGHKSQSKKLLPPNSIMVTCIGTGGVVALNAKPGHTNQQINSIILKDMVYLEWLFFTCKSMKSTIEMFGATGSTMTNLSKGKFEKLKVIEPTRDLIEQYHTITNPVLEEIKRLTLVNESIIRQRDLLLPRLMSGKLEV